MYNECYIHRTYEETGEAGEAKMLRRPAALAQKHRESHVLVGSDIRHRRDEGGQVGVAGQPHTGHPRGTWGALPKLPP